MTDESAIHIATEAHKIAVETRRDQESHDTLCGERYRNINEALRTIKQVGIAIIGGFLLILAQEHFRAEDVKPTTQVNGERHE